mmetsp:Transcript_33886/g.95356  ORF Transcript_33886/g.95356 Transcript_33886/m.95356 type:complete len:202 (+) Transcript_33886:470-1075(+)
MEGSTRRGNRDKPTGGPAPYQLHGCVPSSTTVHRSNRVHNLVSSGDVSRLKDNDGYSVERPHSNANEILVMSLLRRRQGGDVGRTGERHTIRGDGRSNAVGSALVSRVECNHPEVVAVRRDTRVVLVIVRQRVYHLLVAPCNAICRCAKHEAGNTTAGLPGCHNQPAVLGTCRHIGSVGGYIIVIKHIPEKEPGLAPVVGR